MVVALDSNSIFNRLWDRYAPNFRGWIYPDKTSQHPQFCGLTPQTRGLKVGEQESATTLLVIQQRRLRGKSDKSLVLWQGIFTKSYLWYSSRGVLAYATLDLNTAPDQWGLLEFPGIALDVGRLTSLNLRMATNWSQDGKFSFHPSDQIEAELEGRLQ